jgi:iron complex transport system substrate-binding protein
MRSRVISSRIFLSLLLSFLVLFTACGGTGQNSIPTLSQSPAETLDAYGSPISFSEKAPQRIVSLVPNISEILGSLGLGAKVVGVDYYTNYPATLTSLPKVSDVNGKYSVEKIVALKPDLVLSYGEDTKQYDAQLQSVGLHVVDLPSGNRR